MLESKLQPEQKEKGGGKIYNSSIQRKSIYNKLKTLQIRKEALRSFYARAAHYEEMPEFKSNVQEV